VCVCVCFVSRPFPAHNQTHLHFALSYYWTAVTRFCSGLLGRGSASFKAFAIDLVFGMVDTVTDTDRAEILYFDITYHLE